MRQHRRTTPSTFTTKKILERNFRHPLKPEQKQSFPLPDAGWGEDRDLAELKAAWSWNFAGAPRTVEQEEKQWFQPQSGLSGTSSLGRQCRNLSCARCGQPLSMDSLISHQRECLGERDSDDDSFSGSKPRWRGPLDKEKPKAIRRPRLSDFSTTDFDFDTMDFLFSRSSPSSGSGSDFFSSRTRHSFPRQFGGWASASSNSGAKFNGNSSRSTPPWFGNSDSHTPNSASPPNKPNTPPQRLAPSLVQATPSGATLDSGLTIHENAWIRFDGSEAFGILYTDVPWPDSSKTSSDALLVQHALKKGAEVGDVKSVLRRLQLRWHPDKWAQKFASRLAAVDAERVLTRVKEIAQIVNSLKAST